jgi:hypothetical protein
MRLCRRIANSPLKACPQNAVRIKNSTFAGFSGSALFQKIYLAGLAQTADHY